MDTLEKPPSAPPRSLPEAVTRTLRHEVGDLLQTIYATVAILQRRLPEESALEQRLLADMKKRAETCKRFLDVVHDFVCPMTLSAEVVDLAELASSLKQNLQSRHPELEIQTEYEAHPRVEADPRRLVQVGELVLENACEAARHRVTLRTSLDLATAAGEWTIVDDGSPVSDDQLHGLFAPFSSTRQGRPSVGIALAHKLVTLQGGTIAADKGPEGGLRVRISLPLAPGTASEQEG